MANLDLQTISSGDSLDDEIMNNNINILNAVPLTGTTLNDIPTFSPHAYISAESINNIFTKIKENWIDTSDATADAGDILFGETAYVDGKKVTGTIATKSSSDLTVNKSIVSVPAGYYPSGASKSVPTVGLAKPSISVDSTTGVITASVTQGSGYVSGGTMTNSKKLQTQAATTITPSTYRQTAVPAGYYTTGVVFVNPVPTQTKSATPSKSQQTVTPDSGKFLSSVTIGAIPRGYITTSDATATESYIASGKTAYVKGNKVTGTIPEYTVNHITLISPYSYAQVADQFSTTYYIAEDGLFRKNTKLESSMPLSEFGDATAADVAVGKTFTSAAGLKVPGKVNTISTSQIQEADSIHFNDSATYDDGSYDITFKKTFTSDQLYRTNSVCKLTTASSNFGDATAADVAVGKTFTSASGLKIPGTSKSNRAMEYYYDSDHEEDIFGVVDGNTLTLNIPLFGGIERIPYLFAINRICIGKSSSSTSTSKYRYRLSGVLRLYENAGSWNMVKANDSSGMDTTELSVSYEVDRVNGDLIITIVDDNCITNITSAYSDVTVLDGVLFYS